MPRDLFQDLAPRCTDAGRWRALPVSLAVHGLADAPAPAPAPAIIPVTPDQLPDASGGFHDMPAPCLTGCGNGPPGTTGGVVVLQCVIDAEGRVSDARVLRGHPLLDAAALGAVRRRRYEPTRLNGVAVPVVMTVTVTFQPRR